MSFFIYWVRLRKYAQLSLHEIFMSQDVTGDFSATDAFHLKSLEYPYNKIGMVLHLWEPKGTFLTKFYKTGYDLWIKSSWLSTSNDPLITELVEIMDCENILQAGIELGVYFDHISGLCSNFDLGLWPSEAFYWPYYITDINRLVE